MGAISHTFRDETPEAKARWFQSLTPDERMAVFCEYTDLALSLNPNLPELKDAEQIKRGIRILRKK